LATKSFPIIRVSLDRTGPVRRRLAVIDRACLLNGSVLLQKCYSGPKVRLWEITVASAQLLTEGLQVRVLAGHSDDEKPRSAHDGVAPRPEAQVVYNLCTRSRF
jgi:hypothetical protein